MDLAKSLQVLKTISDESAYVQAELMHVRKNRDNAIGKRSEFDHQVKLAISTLEYRRRNVVSNENLIAALSKEEKQLEEKLNVLQHRMQQGIALTLTNT